MGNDDWIHTINFTVSRDEGGRIKSFSLTARDRLEASDFCKTFAVAWIHRQARIDFKKGKIIFVHPTHEFIPKECSFSLEPDDIKTLRSCKDKNSSGLRISTEADGFRIDVPT